MQRHLKLVTNDTPQDSSPLSELFRQDPQQAIIVRQRIKSIPDAIESCLIISGCKERGNSFFLWRKEEEVGKGVMIFEGGSSPSNMLAKLNKEAQRKKEASQTFSGLIPDALRFIYAKATKAAPKTETPLDDVAYQEVIKANPEIAVYLEQLGERWKLKPIDTLRVAEHAYDRLMQKLKEGFMIVQKTGEQYDTFTLLGTDEKPGTPKTVKFGEIRFINGPDPEV